MATTSAAEDRSTAQKLQAGGIGNGKSSNEEASLSGVSDIFGQGWLSKLHRPGENPQLSDKLREEHLKTTGGKVLTRFPPEPNGFLHIGHSKAIAVNFGFAQYHSGFCYLRYDDTNPEAEEQIYFDKILETVRWLGYEPWKITHASDHFERLYQLAVELIKRDKAYTCTDTPERIQADRGGDTHGERRDSKDRSKPIDQCLREFEDMRAGKYQPGEMTLRMKMDMQSGNPQMWDLIAYRVLRKPHHRTGDSWCIYPTYDFTHCLCDSFENITHSLCTTEFITARPSYEWLCDALEVYKPRQSEYGRLELEGAITSKRKLLKLVTEQHVNGWDDPRLYTLVALKRRGVPPAAILNFVSSLGVSTSKTSVKLSRFEQTVRQMLEMSTPRLMMLLRPIKVVLENVPEDFFVEIEKPLHPKVPEMGSNKVPLTKVLYIDADDFKAEADKDFFRLAPGATVGLFKAPCPITYVSHDTDADGKVTSIVCRYENGDKPPKPKTYIQWVGEHANSRSPVYLRETRLMERLFKSDNPGALKDAEMIADLNPSSLTLLEGTMIETGIWDVVRTSLAESKRVVEERKKTAEAAGLTAPPSVDGLECVRFQAMRVAYFCLDSEDTKLDAQAGTGDLVLNQIAALKQDAGKVPKPEPKAPAKPKAPKMPKKDKDLKEKEKQAKKEKKEKERAAAAAAAAGAPASEPAPPASA